MNLPGLLTTTTGESTDEEEATVTTSDAHLRRRLAATAGAVSLLLASCGTASTTGPGGDTQADGAAGGPPAAAPAYGEDPVALPRLPLEDPGAPTATPTPTPTTPVSPTPWEATPDGRTPGEPGTDESEQGPPGRTDRATPTPRPTPSPTPSSTPPSGSEGTDGDTDTGGRASPDRVLEAGDRGEAVRRLQQRLVDLRYWVGPTDGIFGSLTEQAVLAFQGWEGLTQDGVVGPDTRRALERAHAPRPQADDGDLIEIHRDPQVLLVVRDGGTRWAFNTSTGTGERYRQPDGDVATADTPAGRWTISWQVDGWRDAALGRLWRPKYFHRDGLAIHGYPEVPARSASHGCARVSMEAMDFIWGNDLAPEGTTVAVL